MNNLLYIADRCNHRVRVVNLTTGIITTFAGQGIGSFSGIIIQYNNKLGDDGPATSARLNYPAAVAVDSANNLVYIADNSNYRVRVVNRTSGIINTVAGSGMNLERILQYCRLVYI